MIQRWHIHNQFEMDNICGRLRSFGYTGEALIPYKNLNGWHYLYNPYKSVMVIDHQRVSMELYHGYRLEQANGTKEYELGIDFKKVSEHDIRY